MADSLGTVEKIAKVALAIKHTVDTVRRNTRECREIRSRAVRVSVILSQLKEAEMMKGGDAAAADMLEALEKALTSAHELVANCQRKSVVCHFCSAGGHARQLREAKQDISDRMMDVVFVINAGMTIMLASVQASLIHHQPKPERGSAVPKFGDWDQKDPSAGEGYTLRFDEVRGERGDTRHCRKYESSHLTGDERGHSLDLHGPVLQASSSLSLPERGSAVRWFGEWDGKDPSAAEGYTLRFDKLRGERGDTGHCRKYESSGAGRLETSLSSRGRSQLTKSPPSHFPEIKGSFSSLSPSLLSMGLDGPMQFPLSMLEAATNAFSEKNIVGRGGTAIVYKGVLDGGLVVAIKKLHAPDKFLLGSRLERILKISNRCRHKNIVGLLGHCHERRKAFLRGEEQLFFVEEYMPNGSLDRIISGSKLNWDTCFRIIRGIADGLCYLHEADVIHMDLKLENVLLDSDMSPKIADFGLSRFLPNGDKSIEVENFEGTLGYAAPEYIIAGRLSKKNDVYSFGLMVLEIICSMISRSKPLRGQASVKWAREALQKRQDYSNSVAPEYASATNTCIKMAMKCISVRPDDRPSMRDVVEMLKDTKM